MSKCNKQDCALVETLVSIIFSATLMDAFKDFDKAFYIQFRSDGKLFNLRQIRAWTKIAEAL